LASKIRTLRGLLHLYRYALRHWRLIVLAYVSAAVLAGTEGYFIRLFGPYVQDFQHLLDGEDVALPAIERLYDIALIILGMAPVIAVAAFCAEIFGGGVLWRLMADIRNAICSALLPQSLGFFENRRSGDLMSRITNDVERTRTAFQLLFEGIPKHLFMFIVGVVLALMGSWQLVLGGLVVVPVIVGPVGYLARRIRRYSKEGLEKLSDLTDQMSQMFSGIRSIKAFKMEDAERDEFLSVNRKFLGKMLKTVRMRALSAGTMELVLRAIIGGLALGATWLIFRGYLRITQGNLVIFLGGSYYAVNSLRKLVKQYNKLQEAVPAAERIIELVNYRPEMQDAPDAQDLERISESIAFEQVCFAYNNEPVLKDVDFTVRPGERIAIIGKSGSGKSTLTALAMRFYDVTDGRVAFDGMDVRKITRGSLLDRIAIVSQQTFLFNRSIADNIRYGRRGATQEEIERAAKMANIHDFIQSLPDGYDTSCGEFGAKLSGGQAQRIAIARALLKDADILILDEAMVGLDTESEALVREALEKLMEGRTTFIITHDLPTIRNADRILVLEDGRLVAEGVHDELMATCNAYRVLYGLEVAVQ
jgi:subfamily B ATP-binding cassette protein MsbA